MEHVPQPTPDTHLERKFVWQHNLAKLDGDMQGLLSRESIGGNAGKVEVAGKKYNCAAANGFANPETGEIIAFGNIQDIPNHIKENSEEFTLRVAFDWKKGFFNITDIVGGERLSSKVQGALHEAITKFNVEHEKDKAA